MPSLLRLVVRPPPWLRGAALAAFVVVAINLFWQGAQPHAVGLIPPPWDKLAHLVVFGGFAGSAWVALGGSPRTADLLAPLAAVAVGAADEVAQSFLPGRMAGLDDLAADATGAVLAVVVLAMLRRRFRVERPKVAA